MNTKQRCKPAHPPVLPAAIRLSPLAVMVMLASGLLSASVAAREYFDPAFLSGGAAGTDLSAFETAGYVPPGRYLVDIYMNRTLVSRQNIQMREVQGRIRPVLQLSWLKSWGVNADRVPALKGRPDETEITDLSVIQPQAKSEFNLSKLALNLSIPQVAMKPGFAEGDNSALWDDGIPALMSSYNFSGAEGKSTPQQGSETRNRTLFASFRNGLNVGPWRLHSTQTFSYTNLRMSGSGSYAWRTQIPTRREWRTSNTYLSRDIAALRSHLVAGEGSTGGDILDSIPFRGVQMTSEDGFLRDSQRGFAPVIRGTANSDAVVRVKQNGYIVYQTNVAAGPFRIEDMGQQGSSGDLLVEVTEADGSRHAFTVGYSSLPIMQREGGIEYEATVGKYHGGSVTTGSREPEFAMGSLVYGLPYDITAYSGGVLASNYHAGTLGARLSLGQFGAMSLDVTQARSRLHDSRGNDLNWVDGQSWRARYSKSMVTTGTSVSLAALRYNSRNFYSFNDINMQGYDLSEGMAPWTLDRQRQTWQATLSQQLPADLGSVSVSGSRSNYWGRTGTNDSLSMAYYTTIKGATLSVSYDIDRIQRSDSDWPENRQLSVSLSVPFSIFSHDNRTLQGMSASYSMTHDNQGRVSSTTGVNGDLYDSGLSYNVTRSWGNQQQPEQSGLSLSWAGKRLTGYGGYSDSSTYKSLNWGLSGGLLVHPYGVTLSRILGDGAVLVRAPGAPGVMVNGYDRTDWRGYAVVPSAAIYRKNSVTLDPGSLPDGVELDNSSKNVYPTRGAVVLAEFRVRSGKQILLTLRHNGKPVPFGAIATLAKSTQQSGSGIVGDDGQVYLSGMPAQGEVQVRWGEGVDRQCRASYQAGGSGSITLAQAECR
ncbi:hypothetical protein BL250_07320 [Erwinia sp. OLTSP20]|uniref:fimbria/pilus outer membrane usher protein n=1 Tax=unclassified Erwinia TaxID=2622719 RepID=UPI000C58CD06|nr:MULTISPECIES: fimbria/pilus outer membrane usher protein [unclassified Erwinia]PIJ50586.1 hypothetical protein BV501_08125 [Erwinia sp. OAMSP11]PIJ72904.1 hypothetical protein BK416_08400 [Erwinia sp. OLSSP12]PIJ82234.1 hypothetical protein BLD47_06860 [Erwinia sp. OLCASP19]PIJ84787.1 hypothetical protein BLD46_07255 [Erwinia sp. OLMTSP26]PIJ86752.1 hypothetical protein BLD49_07980 [Erwinia sp. OLMDSP33]